MKEEEKLPFLLQVLQRTPPPVLVFAENKRDVDAVHEFLLQRGVEAVAVHGDKDQEERSASTDAFRWAAALVLPACFYVEVLDDLAARPPKSFGRFSIS